MLSCFAIQILFVLRSAHGLLPLLIMAPAYLTTPLATTIYFNSVLLKPYRIMYNAAVVEWLR